MVRKSFTAIVLMAALLVMTCPAMAINFGEPDNGDHPYVGLMGLPVNFGPGLMGFSPICSGTLIAHNVFLTAGHCAHATYTNPQNPWPGVPVALVTFDEEPDEFSTYHLGFAYWHNLFNASEFTPPATYDIGVVVLTEFLGPLPSIDPATIAPVGYLDTYKTQVGRHENTVFDIVGYGFQSIMPEFEWDLARYKAEQRIINLVNHHTDGYNVMLTNNPGLGNGSGGTCSGDSGGPVLEGDMVVAINSFGIAPYCKGNDFAYRVDIESSHAFLCPFIPSLCPQP